MSLYPALPFALLLLCTALPPLMAHHFWEKARNKALVALGLSRNGVRWGKNEEMGDPMHRTNTLLSPEPLLVRAAQHLITNAGDTAPELSDPWYKGLLHFLANLAGARTLTYRDEHLLPDNLEGVSFQGVRVDKKIAEAIVRKNGSLNGAILVGGFFGTMLNKEQLCKTFRFNTKGEKIRVTTDWLEEQRAMTT
ncbi:MAG TPA: hypothetical protein VJC18_03725 [bacterium]|nr:hypothetical protein [bacterium]